MLHWNPLGELGCCCKRVITTKSSLTKVELTRRHKEWYCRDIPVQILLLQKWKEEYNSQSIVNGGRQKKKNLVCRKQYFYRCEQNECIKNRKNLWKQPSTRLHTCIYAWESCNVKTGFAIYKRVLRLMCLDRLCEWSLYELDTCHSPFLQLSWMVLCMLIVVVLINQTIKINCYTSCVLRVGYC